MRALSTVLDLIGAACIIVAASLVAVSLGILVAGVAALVIAYGIDE